MFGVLVFKLILNENVVRLFTFILNHWPKNDDNHFRIINVPCAVAYVLTLYIQE